MIAEPWEPSARTCSGDACPGTSWLQWNDRYRDHVRAFLRAEPGWCRR